MTSFKVLEVLEDKKVATTKKSGRQIVQQRHMSRNLSKQTY